MNASGRERILFIAREFTAGGAAWLALRHMRRLLPRYEIDFVVTGCCEEKMLRQLPAEVTLFKLDAGRIESDVDALCLEFFLKYHATEPFRRTYRAVLATSVFPDWHACIAVHFARAARKLVFLVDEGLECYPRLGPQQRSAIECCIAATGLVVPVSRRLRQRMADSCPALRSRPWEELRPPVDVDNIVLQSRAPAPEWAGRGTPVVLSVARLTPDKQIMESLHVHHRLRQAGVEFHWIVVGTGPEEAALRAEIDRLGMADTFLLPGNQGNIYSWMKHCDVFAMLSRSEGCPTVVIEALLLDRPVIMTDVNGSDELIQSGRNGLVVPNDPEAIAEGLSRLILDPGLREQFSRNLVAEPPVADAVLETAWLVEKIEEPDIQPPASAAPKVTILIPAYNHEHCIDRAIASALMQEFSSLEVVVCDDTSGDRTESAARAWEYDPRFRYVRNESNIGRVANYRRALTEHARGEWVLMLDGDDHLIDPAFIRLAWKTLQRHAGRSPLFVQAGHRVHYLHDDRANIDILPIISRPERLMAPGEYLRFVFKTGFFTHLGTLYNRKAAIQHKFYTADISSSDMDSLLRLSLEGSVVVVNSIAGCWVQHRENASSSLPLEKIRPNVRIFRHISWIAIRRGLVSVIRINRHLTRYEAHTLFHLFSQAIGKNSRGLPDVLRMLWIMISINPLLLLNRRLMSFLTRSIRKQTVVERDPEPAQGEREGAAK